MCYVTSSRGATMCAMSQRPMARQLRRQRELRNETVHASAANSSFYLLSTLSLGYLRAALNIDVPFARGRKGNMSRPSRSSVGFTASSSSPPTSQPSGGHQIPRRRPARCLDVSLILPTHRHLPPCRICPTPHRCRMNSRLQCDLARKVCLV
jgi:hypothetical protein